MPAIQDSGSTHDSDKVTFCRASSVHEASQRSAFAEDEATANKMLPPVSEMLRSWIAALQMEECSSYTPSPRHPCTNADRSS
eukprot:178320-Rhodomonas_salina.1